MARALKIRACLIIAVVNVYKIVGGIVLDNLMQEKCREIRRLTMECIASIGVGHVGGCLSIVDLLTVLYYDKMNVDPKNPKMDGRDRLVVSKGHAGPAVYAALCSKGYFSKDELLTLNKFGTKLPSHCDMNLTTGIDMTAGSLGQGFSCSVGIAIGSQISKDDATIYAVIGDGESQEGQIWEAAMFAVQRKLGNLIAFTDNNKMQIDGMTSDINELVNLADRWRAFGWHVQEVDGHDMDAISKAIDAAKEVKSQPSMVVMSTVKGKGVSFVEEILSANHNMPITAEQLEIALKELV